MLKISVLVSGGGTNLQAIIDGIQEGKNNIDSELSIVNAEIVQVISSKKQAFALKRAEKHGIKTVVADHQDYPDSKERNQRILEALRHEGTDLVVLAGYMSILDSTIVREYAGKIINIHPSLIPKYCGTGYYGKRVHQAVLDNKETESGATVHIVDEGVDTGPIILQEKVPVNPEDSADTLAARVLETEHRLLRKVIKEAAVKGGF